MRLGIDFGTSSTKMAASCGDDLIYAGPAWPAPIPSALGYHPETDRLSFGSQAWQDQQPGALLWPFFKLALKRHPHLSLGSLDLEAVLSAFFTFLKQHLPARPHDPWAAVTLSVPNYFGLKARHSLLLALQQVFPGAAVNLLPEPVSALIGYQALHPQQVLPGDVLVIDVGAGTSDFSFISTAGRQRQLVLETQLQMGQDAFSGAEVDKALLRAVLAPLFHMNSGQALPAALLEEKALSPSDRAAWTALMGLAEAAKLQMSCHGQAAVNLHRVFPGLERGIKIDPELFSAALSPLWQRLEAYLEAVLKPRARSLGLYDQQGWKIDQILLLGGGSYTPGLLQRVQKFFAGIPLHHGAIDRPYVAAGNCLWQAAGNELYTIYPFHFYIEKNVPQEGGRQLELIPFDTANLELDLTGRYRVLSVPIPSAYNLAGRPQDAEIKIYELSSESMDTRLDRFSGRDVVLHWQKADYDGPDMVHIEFDMKTSQLSVNFTTAFPPRPDAELLADWPARQLSGATWLSAYKHIDRQLLQALLKQLQENRDNGDSVYSNQLKASYYKLLCVLQVLNP